MAKRSVYMPILWAKDGEYGALQQLPRDIKSRLTPILEVPPIPWDFAIDRPARSIDQHLEKTAKRIEKAWGTQDPILLDFEWIDPSERLDNGSHPLAFVFADARLRKLKLVPVVTLARDDAYRNAVSSVVRSDAQGLGLRLLRDDLVEGDLAARVRELLNRIDVVAADVDLIIDVRGVSAERVEEIGMLVGGAVEALPRLNDWRSFVLAGTAFPDTLGGMPPSGVTRIPRAEWTLWQRTTRKRGLKRIPIFGDYGISSAAPPDVDPRVMKPSASVRYTAEDDWVVFKGKNLKDHGYDQFHDVCRRVVRAPEYSGTDFSWGDHYIYECAGRRASRGNLTTWRKVGTSHHLTFVVDQIAKAA